MSERNHEDGNDGTSDEDRHTDPTAPPPYPQEYGTPPPPPPPSTGSPFGAAPPPPAGYPGPGQDSPAPGTGASPYAGSPYGAPGPTGSPYGAPPYGTPASPYGTPPPAYYQSAAPQSNTSALVLTIVSAIGTLSCCLPLPALILGIVALTKQTTEPERSAQLAKYGWVTFGIMVGLAVVAFIVFMGFAIVSAPTTTYDY